MRTGWSFVCLSVAVLAHADHTGAPRTPSERPSSPRQILSGDAECDALRQKFSDAGESLEQGAMEQPDGKANPAHSAMGDHYSEGRRRQTPLWGGTGHVRFPSSTQNKEAQKFLEQGLGQLHGYDRSEAERSFRQALKLDPRSAMAYVGLILTTSGKRAEGFLKELEDKLSSMKMDDRERAWVQVARSHVEGGTAAGLLGEKGAKEIQALERLLAKHPDDIEARAFLGHLKMEAFTMNPGGTEQDEMPPPNDAAEAVVQGKERREMSKKQAEEIDAIFQEVLKVEPRHPVHHYRIHLWDGLDSKRALDSARVLGSTAPEVGHMWHMPGHTYSDLGMYREAIAQQEASVRVDNRRLEKGNLFPHEHGDYAHNQGWLVNNMRSAGMVNRAIETAKNLIKLPGDSGARSEGFRELVKTLRHFEKWDEALALAETPYLAAQTKEEEIEKQLLLGMAYANQGRKAQLDKSLRAIECLAQKPFEHESLNIDIGALKKALQTVEEAGANLGKPIEAEEDGADRVGEVLGDLLKKAEPTPTEAEAPETGEGEPGPGPGTLPAMPFIEPASSSPDLLKIWSKILESKPEEALALYKGLPPRTMDPNFPVEKARLAFRLGRRDEAKQILTDHLDESRGPDAASLALLTQLQSRTGQAPEARANYAKLQKLMEPADKRDGEEAVFGGLMRDNALQKAGGLGKGAPLWKEDAEHPRLASMGPLTWTPPPAPAVTASTVEGKKVSLADYQKRGRNVMVVFNLGTTCPHCNTQLNLLKEKAADYKAAGIDVLVVTNEGGPKLKESHDALTENDPTRPLPFALAADPSLASFKAMNVFDDFEEIPLHGMYLVDADGKMRWRDVGHEPNMKLDAVLRESKRLLSFKK